MPISAGQIADKISRLRSQVAIYDALLMQLQANYSLRDGVSIPEQSIYREDGGRVPPDHIKIAERELTEKVAELRVELERWERSIFHNEELQADNDTDEDSDEDEESDDEDDDEEEEPAPKPKENKKNVPAPGKRPNRNLSAAK